ncbi:MAG: hypothetical protein ACPGVT_13480 [Maricaulaceae bacterium]
MRIFKILSGLSSLFYFGSMAIALLVFIVIVGSLTLKQNRFDLRSNAIVQAIQNAPETKRWGEPVELIPYQFSRGEPRSSVMKKLAKDEFVKSPHVIGHGMIEDTQNQPRFRTQAELDRGREIYLREAHTAVCLIHVHVFLEFDEMDRLVSADGAQLVDACL